MTYLQKYRAYLRDNPKGYWFRRKLYGWGWVPATWEGALVTIAAALAIGFTFANFSLKVQTWNVAQQDVTDFITNLLIAVVGLALILYWKGERPRWQWGTPKD